MAMRRAASPDREDAVEQLRRPSGSRLAIQTGAAWDGTDGCGRDEVADPAWTQQIRQQNKPEASYALHNQLSPPSPSQLFKRKLMYRLACYY